MRFADVSGPMLGRVVKENVTFIALGEYCVIGEGICLKFCKEQILHTELGENLLAEVSVSI